MKTIFPFLALFLATSAEYAGAEPVPAQATQAQVSVNTHDQRRKILLNELATEKKSLSEANAALSEAMQSETPSEEIRALAARILGHSSNIEALQRELDKVLPPSRQTQQAPFVIKPSSPSKQTLSTKEDAPYWDVYHRKQNHPPVKDVVADPAANQPILNDEEGAPEPAN